jgi:hypothetical protein
MKRILIFLFVLSELVSYGQAKIGMSPVFSFTPSAAASPTVGVPFGTVVDLKVYIKNTGNVAFNSWINLTANVDTIGGVLCDSSYVLINLLPNDSVASILTFTPAPGMGAFKVGGNGNTIVVWPKIVWVTGIQGDSVRPVIWISGTNSIFEFEKNQFNVYPNPVINTLNIKSQNSTAYKKIIIYDVFARKVKELSFKETIDVSELKAGTYWMLIASEDKSYRANFIKE